MQNPGDGADAGERPDPLPEDFHAVVDAAISSMKKPKPDHYQVICRAYIANQLDHRIAEAMKLSRSTVRSLREAAEVWVESRLYECTSSTTIELPGC